MNVKFVDLYKLSCNSNEGSFVTNFVFKNSWYTDSNKFLRVERDAKYFFLLSLVKLNNQMIFHFKLFLLIKFSKNFPFDSFSQQDVMVCIIELIIQWFV